ncbi:MAG: ABC transporter permease [Actinomycetota bacterium]
MAFLKKEFTAIFKTYRWWVIPLVFLIFALMSPPTAKLTPELLKSVMPKGMNIKLPEPTLIDAFAQWFKNLSQMGLLAVILLTMGIVAEEKSSGTILLIVTKPISRANVVLSKFAAQVTWMSASFMLAAAVCYGYAIMIFKFDRIAEFVQANVLFVLYFVVIIAVTIFFSTVLKNQIAAGGLSLVTALLLSLVSSLSQTFDKYAPTGLTTVGSKIALGQTGTELTQAIWPVLTSLVLIAGLLLAAIVVFNREEL